MPSGAGLTRAKKHRIKHQYIATKELFFFSPFEILADFALTVVFFSGQTNCRALTFIALFLYFLFKKKKRRHRS